MVPPSSAAITGGSPASAARPTGASSGGSSRGSAEPSIWRTTWSGPPAEGSIDQVASSVRIEPCSRPSMATSVTELIGAPGTCPDQASAPPRSVSRRSSSARTTTPGQGDLEGVGGQRGPVDSNCLCVDRFGPRLGGAGSPGGGGNGLQQRRTLSC